MPHERFLPDGGGLVSFIQPVLRRNDVHAPQAPVVAVSGVSVLLHLEGVVLDVIYRRQDYPTAGFFYPGQDRLGPEEERGEKQQTSPSQEGLSLCTCLK